MLRTVTRRKFDCFIRIKPRRTSFSGIAGAIRTLTVRILPLSRDELEDYKKQCGGRFDAQFTLTRVDKAAVPNWPYTFGRINLDMAKAILPPPADDVLILICGRPDMGKTAKAFCQELGYPNVHAY